MATIASLIVNIAADTAELKKGVSDTAQTMSSMEDRIKAVGTAIAGAFSIGAIAQAGKQALDTAGQIQDAAERIGISAESVQKLKFAAEQGGSSLEAVAASITKMSDVLGDPGKGAAAALESLGLSVDHLRKMKPDEAFTAIADAIAKVPDPLRQAALNQELLGKGAAQLLPAIKAGLTEIGDQAPLMSNALIAAGDQAGDKLAEMQQKMVALKAQALIPLMETFTSMPESVQVAIVGLSEVGPVLTNIGVAIMAAGGPTAALGVLKGALAAVGGLLTLPAGAVAAAIVGLVLVFKHWDQISDIAKSVYDGVKGWLVDKFEAIVGWVGEKVDAITGFFKGMYERLVGGSIVPETIEGIASNFAQLDAVMVQPVAVAVDQALAAFAHFKDSAVATVQETMALMNQAVPPAITALGGVGGGTGLIPPPPGGAATAAAPPGLLSVIGQSPHFNPTKGFGAPLGGATPGGVLALFAAGYEKWLKAGGTAGIPAFGDGGMVTKPTIALLGEKGPEAVIPLNRGGGVAGPTVNVNMSGMMVTSDPAAAAELRRWVQDAVFEGVRNSRKFSPAL